MAGAPTPRMHGSTHAPGGPDPIVGLGAGGGELGWDDVGTTGVLDYRLPHAIFKGTAIGSTGGETNPLWGTLVASFMPAGTFVEIYTADPTHLRFNQTGDYQVHFYLVCGGTVTGTPPVMWQINGGVGGCVVQPLINGQYVPAGGSLNSPYVEFTTNWHITSGTPTYRYMALLGTGASLPTPQFSATVVKLS